MITNGELEDVFRSSLTGKSRIAAPNGSARAYAQGARSSHSRLLVSLIAIRAAIFACPEVRSPSIAPL